MIYIRFQHCMQIQTLSKKIVSLAGLSNFMELYNYILFAAMIPVISSVFFPHESSFVSLSLTYASFGITFLIAPIGAMYWGKIGDQFGPNKVLQYSSLLMAIPSIIIAFLPSFESIGLFAPILIILLRLLQGFSASGEVQGSKILAMSNVPDRHFGKVSGFISGCGAFGVMLAFYLAQTAMMHSNPDAWRYCFGLGGTLVIASRAIKYLFRNKTSIKNDNISAANVLMSNKYKVLFVFVIGGVLGILSYTLHAFFNPYIVSLGHHSKGSMYSMSLVALLTTAISAFACGFIIDKIKQSQLSIFLLLILCSIVISMPICWKLILSNELSTIAFAYALVGVNLGFYACCSGVAIFKVFSPSQVCRGLLPSNAAGVAFFGGLAPITMHFLTNIDHFLPVYLIGGVCGLAFIQILKFNRNSSIELKSQVA